jgi:hypothetical protein
MRSIVLTLFMVLMANPAFAADPPPLYQQGDAESRFREAQLHVRQLMKDGKYKEASAFMSVYQKLACEATEQKAGRSTEEGVAYCANKHNQAGVSANSVQQRQQERLTAESISDNILAPGITVMQRPVPGTPTMLDGSAPSLLMFDPRTDAGRSGSSSGSERRTADPWTGGH